MRRGKEIAQGSHAAMAFLTDRIRQNLSGPIAAASVRVDLSALETLWLARGMAKICLRVHSEDELLAHHRQAQALGLNSTLIVDSGRTEFNGVATLTACAIGPAEAERIDRVTGALEPY